MPYVLGFVGVLLFAEIVWRIGLYGMIRLEGHGIENLYVIGMDELLAKDAAFFHDNFAGSLTKRVLSFASRFEDFTDNLVFNIVGSLVPLAFASVVLWRYDPLLVAGLIGLIAITGAGIAPLIRRRQKLVDQREEAIARVSGHVADSLMNMDTIRAFAAEDREAAEHRSRVADQRRKTQRSWDYENLRDRHAGRADVCADQRNRSAARGLTRRGASMESRRSWWHLPTIQRDADHVRVQPDLPADGELADRSRAVHRVAPHTAGRGRPGRARAAQAEGEQHQGRSTVTFAHAGGLPLFTGLDLTVPGETSSAWSAGPAEARAR